MAPDYPDEHCHLEIVNIACKEHRQLLWVSGTLCCGNSIWVLHRIFQKEALVSSVDNQMLVIPACLQSGTVNASAKEKIHVYLLLIHSFIWAARPRCGFQGRRSEQSLCRMSNPPFGKGSSGDGELVFPCPGRAAGRRFSTGSLISDD